jgi:transcriptional regulator with XRE-family HTH domain
MTRYEQLRYERNLTQQDVARGAGISRPTVIRLEQDAAAKPSPAVAHKLAKFYEISLGELLGLEDRSAA